ncbi:hypothetical protein VSS37_03670 [Candidatus Thiothrix sp. Deng01]|uniref:Uncharacterized protein n=1 Tax=Candidatus Thiothrix phosphatis TaxID=3112415 RepID=A0ABU6CTJ2_9GAMM|nr:hypothetical protein [Candidatus Thiothrix sp. Deng01]MEB4590069.1 hypothetical protein [Candidatus Thiothrix sp. Deng01]
MSENHTKTPGETRPSRPRQTKKTTSTKQANGEAQQQIEVLTALVQQKEQELAELHGQTHLIEELTEKLRATETAMEAVRIEAQTKTRQIRHYSKILTY